jgi:hypothetical protein
MSNGLYAKAREGFLRARIDWVTATIKCSLVRGYTPVLSTHEFVSDLTGAGGTLAYTVTLASKTATGGAADAADVLFSAVTGTAIQHAVIYQSSAVTGGADVATSAQRLIALFDYASGTGFPFTPNGQDFGITWSDAAYSKIFLA